MNKRANLLTALDMMKTRGAEIPTMENRMLVRYIGTIKEWEMIAHDNKDCNDLWYTFQELRLDFEREVLNRMK